MDTYSDFSSRSLLLQTIEDVMTGKADASSLSELIEKTRENLKDTRLDFDMVVSGQPSGIKDACKDSIAAVNRCFEEYTEALDETASYLSKFDKSILERVYDKIVRVSEELDRAFFEFRQEGLIALGPTRVPGINLLIHTSNRILDGEQLLDELREQVMKEGGVVEETFEELQQTWTGTEGEAYRKAYEAYLDTLDRLLEYFETQDKETLEKIVDSLVDVGQLFEEASGVGLQEELSREPTGSPLANIVINSAFGVREGTVDREFFARHLHLLWEELQGMKFKYNALLRTPPDSSVIEEESVIVGEILQMFEEALILYFDFLDTSRFDLIDEAAKKLEISIEEMQQSVENLQALSKREGKIPCVKCGHYNPSKNRVCEQCSAVLPAIANQATSTVDFVEGQRQTADGLQQQTVMTENVQKLFDAANSYARGEITAGEFESILSWMENLLQKSYQSAGPLPQVDVSKKADRKRQKQFKQILGESADLYIQGLEDFEVGLSFLRQFLTDVSAQSMQAGMQMIWQGMGKLQEVQKVLEPLVKKK